MQMLANSISMHLSYPARKYGSLHFSFKLSFPMAKAIPTGKVIIGIFLRSHITDMYDLKLDIFFLKPSNQIV